MPGSATRERPARRGTRHADDLATWVEEQVALLRAGRLGEVDAQNVAEELADVGRSEYGKLESALTVLLTYMLEWDHRPERRSRSWDNTIETQRLAYRNVLLDNPGLKSKRAQALERAYARARLDASSETNLPRATFATDCPYDWPDILDRPFDYEGHRDG